MRLIISTCGLNGCAEAVPYICIYNLFSLAYSQQMAFAYRLVRILALDLRNVFLQYVQRGYMVENYYYALFCYDFLGYDM